jgi:hypothetical protein
MSSFKRFEFASGEVHEKYLRAWGWYIAIFLAVVAFFLSGYNWLYPAFILYHFVLCEFHSPDLDQIGLSKDEGDILRTFKKLKIGLAGAVIVAWWFIYAYFIGLLGGHRSWASHGWVIGTIGRIIFFNIPFAVFLAGWHLYGVANWGYDLWSEIGWGYFYMDKWLSTYLVCQFVSWNIGDGIHLILDTEWAKGRLYQTRTRRAKL